MNGEELAASWKDPDAREDTSMPHPAGEIKVGTGARTGRRAFLLAGLTGLGLGITPTLDPTETTPQTVTSLSRS